MYELSMGSMWSSRERCRYSNPPILLPTDPACKLHFGKTASETWGRSRRDLQDNIDVTNMLFDDEPRQQQKKYEAHIR